MSSLTVFGENPFLTLHHGFQVIPLPVMKDYSLQLRLGSIGVFNRTRLRIGTRSDFGLDRVLGLYGLEP